MSPNLIFALIVILFVLPIGRHRVLADLFTPIPIPIPKAIGDLDLELNRSKRSFTTVCVEIKPSRPHEEPYFMCKDVQFRKGSNNGNPYQQQPEQYSSNNDAIVPSYPVKTSEAKSQLKYRPQEYTSDTINNNNNNNNEGFQQPATTYNKNEQYQPPTTYTIDSTKNQPDFIRKQFFPNSKGLPFSTDDGETTSYPSHSTYAKPFTEYGTRKPSSNSNTEGYSGYDPPSGQAAYGRRPFARPSLVNGFRAANAEKTYSIEKVPHAHAPLTTEAGLSAAARPTTFSKSDETPMKDTTLPNDGSEYQGINTNREPKQSLRLYAMPRPTTLNASPKKTIAQQPETERYRAPIDKEVFSVPDWGFLPDEFDFIPRIPMSSVPQRARNLEVSENEDRLPLQVDVQPETRMIPQAPIVLQEQTIPREHMDDPVMRQFYASLDNWPMEIGPVENTVSAAPNQAPETPRSYSTPVAPLTQAQQCVSASDKDHSYQSPQSSLESCKPCQSRDQGFQPIFIAIPYFGQQSNSPPSIAQTFYAPPNTVQPDNLPPPINHIYAQQSGPQSYGTISNSPSTPNYGQLFYSNKPVGPPNSVDPSLVASTKTISGPQRADNQVALFNPFLRPRPLFPFLWNPLLGATNSPKSLLGSPQNDSPGKSRIGFPFLNNPILGSARNAFPPMQGVMNLNPVNIPNAFSNVNTNPIKENNVVASPPEPTAPVYGSMLSSPNAGNMHQPNFGYSAPSQYGPAEQQYHSAQPVYGSSLSSFGSAAPPYQSAVPQYGAVPLQYGSAASPYEPLYGSALPFPYAGAGPYDMNHFYPQNYDYAPTIYPRAEDRPNLQPFVQPSSAQSQQRQSNDDDKIVSTTISPTLSTTTTTTPKSSTVDSKQKESNESADSQEDNTNEQLKPDDQYIDSPELESPFSSTESSVKSTTTNAASAVSNSEIATTIKPSRVTNTPDNEKIPENLGEESERTFKSLISAAKALSRGPKSITAANVQSPAGKQPNKRQYMHDLVNTASTSGYKRTFP